MTCTKTGAHIYIEQYDEYAYCDAFELELDAPGIGAINVAKVAYFRVVEVSFGKPLYPNLHYKVWNVADWFDRERTGLVSTLISDNFTNLGYEGRPI